MGAFGGLILTNKGRNLQAKAQTGVQLNFTKIKIGDGSLSGQSIVDLTDLISTKKELTILGLQTLTGGKVKLRSYFSNTDITTGFYWRELGVFAQDPQEGEILYCYGNAGANAEYIPAGGGPDVVERYINVITLIGNASNISATLRSEIYVTQADFESHASRHAFGGADPLAPADIGAETPSGAQAKVDAHATRTDNPHGVTPVQIGAETPSGAQSKIDTHAGTTQTHGASGSYRLAKTSRVDQLPAWADLPDKPASFPPSAHKSSHASGGTDALSPADIGAAPSSHTHTKSQITDFAHKSTHASGGSDALTPADIGAASQGDLNNHISAADPHPQYALDSDLAALQAAHNAHLADNAAHNIPSHFDPTTGHKHTGAAGDGPKLTHDAINTAAVSAFRAYQSTQQSISAGTWTKVAYQTELFDHLGEYDPALYRFTAQKAGIYLFSACVGCYNVPDGARLLLTLYVNGAVNAVLGHYSTGAFANAGVGGSTLLKLNAGDYVEVYIYVSAAVSTLAYSIDTYFSGVRIA